MVKPATIMSPAAIKIAVDLSSMVVTDCREPQLLKFLQPPMRDFLVHLTVFVVEIVEFAALDCRYHGDGSGNQRCAAVTCPHWAMRIA